ncbi:DegV family protein [Leuconostoc pseudomesenteroides]|uniref:DegV family protein n=1 Tax=Leuconostoc pseudomesenteroides TaxID=33968 RepID=UPI0021AAF2B0|nr:DegV family protein [Leuconostoc pseudomesenteroides]MCT4388014.1 DegV family protein [Leuconostoc pseudomesenteroides]
MSNIKIVTDSAVALTPEEIAFYDIKIVPLSVQIDGTVYEDGVTIQRDEFLEKMAVSKNLPQTSQPSIGAFQLAYDEIHQKYPDSEILSIHMSSGLSGTVRAAEQAAALTSAKITTFDTLAADRAQAFVVLQAAEMAKQGASMAEIEPAIEQARDESNIYLSFTSLTNMVAGGRLSKTQGIIGNLLNIKVGAGVTHTDGTVDVLLKGRGMKTIAKFNNNVIAKMQEYKEMVAIGISHAGIPEEATQLADRLKAIWPDLEIPVLNTTPIISTHTGVGALAILYRAR